MLGGVSGQQPTAALPTGLPALLLLNAPLAANVLVAVFRLHPPDQPPRSTVTAKHPATAAAAKSASARQAVSARV